MTIGKYIREKRKESGLTLVQLGEMTNLTQGFLSRIEIDKVKPSPDVLKRISLTLNLSHLDLMNRAGYIEGITDLQKEIERLREALQEIREKTCFAEIVTIRLKDVHEIARKALEGEPNAI